MAGCFLSSSSELDGESGVGGQGAEPNGGNGAGVSDGAGGTGASGAGGSSNDGAGEPGGGGAAQGGGGANEGGDGGGGGTNCGDGIIDTTEGCDTGANASVGCVNCQIVDPWSCQGAPSVCVLQMRATSGGVPVAIAQSTAYAGLQQGMTCVGVMVNTPAGTTLADLDVEVGIDHNNASDLVLKLWPPGAAPSNATLAATLVSRPGLAEAADVSSNGGIAYADLSSSFPIRFDDSVIPSSENLSVGIGSGDTICEDGSPPTCTFTSSVGSTLGKTLTTLVTDTPNPTGSWTFCAADVDNVGGETGPGDLEVLALHLVLR